MAANPSNSFNYRIVIKLSISRQELGRFIRIITGHNNLFYHRSNVDKTNNTIGDYNCPGLLLL